MSFLVDTNVFSETLKPQPDPKVIAWLRANEGALYVSTITIGEIRRGSQIAATARRHQLTVVTRNTTDFAKTGLKVLNPFA